MSLSQLSGKSGINYAKLRHKKSPNDQQSFGLYENINRDNIQYIESLIQKRKSSIEPKHQRAKSTLDNKQNSYRQGTPVSNLEEMECEKLFDQFFKLNNSKSDSDFMKESIQRETKSHESDFLKFVENAIEYHKQSDVKFFKPTMKRESHYEQKLKEATISNRLLASELNRHKAKESEMKNRMKLMQKEFSLQYSNLIQKCAWLEELLAKQKIDNENSLLAVKKTVEIMQTKCKCSKGVQLYEKILRDVKNQERARPQQYDWQEGSKPSHSSSELSNNTQEEEEYNGYNYQYYDKNRRKSVSKIQHSSIQSSEEQQDQLVQSFINGKSKNHKEFPKEIFLRKLHFQEPYYIKEETTINST